MTKLTDAVESIDKEIMQVYSHNMTNRKVHKKNELIEAKYNLSKMENKLVLICACMISAAQNPLKTLYRISARDLCEILHITNTNNYLPYLKRLALKLQNRKSFQIGGVSFKWFASVEAMPNGIFEFEFSEKLIPYLTFQVGATKEQLKANPFTEYRVSNVLPLKGEYSHRFYELCQQYYPFIKQREFRLDELYALLGIEPGKYERWYDFLNKVLIPSEREVYIGTDIGFKHRISGKDGKKITHITLAIFQGKTRPSTKHVLKESVAAVNKRLKGDQGTLLFENRMQEYYRDLPNFPTDGKPSFKQYLLQKGFKVIKSKDKRFKFDIDYIEGTQAEMDFKPERVEARKQAKIYKETVKKINKGFKVNSDIYGN